MQMEVVCGHLKPAILGGTPAFSARIPMVKPDLPSVDLLLRDARTILESGQITNGRWVREFEKGACDFLGVPECVAVSSCTSGLILLFRCLDLKGEVILPSFTFLATGIALIWNGIRPVFADCDPSSFNIDPLKCESLITPRTSAILGVHLYGNPANVPALDGLAKKHGLRLVFDAAHGFGALREQRRVGVFGDAEVFSLSPTKLLVAGEGGLIATHDSKLAARLRAARNYGDPGTYDPIVVGLNARMPELNAMMAYHGLECVDQQVVRRKALADFFMRELGRLPGVSFQTVRKEDVSTWKDFTMIVDPDEFGMPRDELAVALTAENLEVRKYFFPPLHQQEIYRQYYDPAKQELRVTEQVSSRVLCLPIYSSLKEESLTKVVEVVHHIFRAGARSKSTARR